MSQSGRGFFWGLTMFIITIGCARTPVKPDALATPPPRQAEPPPAAILPTPSSEPEAPAAEVDMISVFFDLDSYVLKPESRPHLQQIAAKAKATNRSLRVEGHCDERGTPEYNLALGEGRARTVEQYLERLGVPKEKLTAVSFGSQRPKASGQNEAAWSQNRRGDVKLE